MKIDEFDAPEISFAIEFKKDMNFNINNLKNEIDLYLMESLKKKSNILDILMWWKVNCSELFVIIIFNFYCFFLSENMFQWFSYCNTVI